LRQHAWRPTTLRGFARAAMLTIAFTAVAATDPAGARVAAGSGGVRATDLPPAPAPPVPAPPTARISSDGRTALVPLEAPPAVQEAISAANRITTKPYRYGGGHRRWRDRGYDCSGSVSYALHGAGLLRRPLASGRLMRWGMPGPGLWISVYANRGHAYLVIAGLRFDTSGPGERGPRWRKAPRSSAAYVVRHPESM
jgi:cell wall-associated NlpC family hydrolase